MKPRARAGDVRLVALLLVLLTTRPLAAAVATVPPNDDPDAIAEPGEAAMPIPDPRSPAGPMADWVGSAESLAAMDDDFRALAEAVRTGTASKPQLRAFFRAYQLLYPFEEAVPRDWRERAWRQIAKQTVRTVGGSNWVNIGPSNVGGRTTGIAIHPTNQNLAFAASADGGVWRWDYDPVATTWTWTPLFEDQPTLATGAIAIDQLDPSRIYVGTGEQNFALDNYAGMGMIRSTDMGASWLPPVPLGGSSRIGAIAIHPVTNSTVFAGASDGVYRSTDFGATWTRVLSGGYGTDVAISRAAPDVVYAGIQGTGTDPSGVWVSTTGGDSGSFTQLLGSGGCTLPSPGAGVRVALALSDASSTIAYAAFEIGQGEVWKTTDAGATWCQATTPGTFCNSQCWYDMVIAADPNDPDHLLAGGLNIYRSLDGAATWTQVTPSPHVDHHAIAFAASGPAMALNGNDGGVYRFDLTAPTTVSRNVESGFTTTQYYGMGHDPLDSTYVYGGTQDNGTQRFTSPSTTTNGVALASCGDGAAIRVHPVNNQRLFHTVCPISSRLHFLVSDNRGGSSTAVETGITTTESSNWVAPIEVASATIIYTATSNRVYRSTNADASPATDITWTPLGTDDLTSSGSLTTIASTAADPNTVWAGNSRGDVWLTRDGSTWTETWRANGGRGRYIGKITASQVDADVAWIALGGLGGSFDSGGHIFETVNGGLSWSDMSGDLPNVPVNSIIQDDAGPDSFWAGTWLGVFRTDNHGANWVRHTSVPAAAVVEMTLDPVNRIVYAATHGRGIWKLTDPSASGPPRPVPDGVYDLGTPMKAVKAPGGMIQVTWDASSCPNTATHHLFYGNLLDKATYTYSGGACDLGLTGSASFTPPAGDLFWLMAGANSLGDESGHRRADGGLTYVAATGVGLCPSVVGRDTSLGCP